MGTNSSTPKKMKRLDFNRTEKIAKIVIEDLRNGGWIVNLEKSHLTPSRTGKWLGTIIDTRDATFTVPAEKVEKLIKLIKTILSQTFCSAKLLSRVAGQLAAMHLSLGPIVRLFSRSLYALIEGWKTWYEPIQQKMLQLIYNFGWIAST